MVTFKLVQESDTQFVYWYYPEGNTNKKPGIIVVDRDTELIRVTVLAEEDWERDIPIEEQNEMLYAINEMKKEQGLSDFLPLATKPIHSIFYGDHAVNEIAKHLNKGEIVKSGKQVWY